MIAVADQEHQNKTKLLFIVHGLGAKSTFSGITPDQLKTQNNDLEVFCPSYPTQAAWIPGFLSCPSPIKNIKEVQRQLWPQMLKEFKKGNGSYRDIRIIGHSQGGLAVASAINYGFRLYPQDKDSKKFLDILKGILFIASPIAGSEGLSWLPTFLRSFMNKQTKELVKGSELREEIINYFMQLHLENQFPLAIYSAKGDIWINTYAELIESIPYETFEFVELDGIHEKCIEDLAPDSTKNEKSSNFNKINLWINNNLTFKFPLLIWHSRIIGVIEPIQHERLKSELNIRFDFGLYNIIFENDHMNLAHNDFPIIINQGEDQKKQIRQLARDIGSKTITQLNKINWKIIHELKISFNDTQNDRIYIPYVVDNVSIRCIELALSNDRWLINDKTINVGSDFCYVILSNPEILETVDVR